MGPNLVLFLHTNTLFLELHSQPDTMTSASDCWTCMSCVLFYICD